MNTGLDNKMLNINGNRVSLIIYYAVVLFQQSTAYIYKQRESNILIKYLTVVSILIRQYFNKILNNCFYINYTTGVFTDHRLSKRCIKLKTVFVAT